MRSILLLAFPALLFVAEIARAEAPYGDPNTPEGWAWAQIRNDQIADFNTHCPNKLDPRRKEGWDDPCRQISPQFLVELLSGPKFRDQVPQHGVRLRGAHIAHPLDLGDREIRPEVWIEASRLEGNVTLDDSLWRRPLSLTGSTVTGDFSAARLRADSAIGGDDALFEGKIDLHGAKIGHSLDMEDSSIEGEVNLGNAKVDDNFYMDGSTFGGDVYLSNATIDGTVSMERASFAGKLHAEGVIVGHDLFMRFGTEFRDKVFLIGAKVGGILELRYAKAWFVDLSRAQAAELQTGGLEWWCAGGQTPNGDNAGTVAGDESLSARWLLGDTRWNEARCNLKGETDPPKLALRNFYVGAFQDRNDAWPPALDLEGFRYEHLGGIAGVSGLANAGPDDMRGRKAAEWIDWLERDRTFSTQPYVQLSSVLAAAGHRDTADAILFAGRERERDKYLAEGNYIQWAWLTFLHYVAGYGIGLYTFYVICPVIFFTVVGFGFLCCSRSALTRHWLWRIGASLHRLLPIISLSKEFQDFFDEPANLGRVAKVYFAIHAIAGWALGFILLAAMGGIIQKT
jgi:hypothetical protein